MQALRTAAPYIRKFRGAVFVVKLGGEVLDAPDAVRSVAEQADLLWQLGIRLVVVHGGGSAIDRLTEKSGLEVEKVAGRRVTSPDVLEAVKMTLGGSVHLDLVAAFVAAGLPAVGLTGLDAAMLPATRRPPVSMDVEGERRTVDFGSVGDLGTIDAQLPKDLLAGGYMPVVAPLTSDGAGNVLNTNADTVAAALAAAMGAEKLLFLLRVPGILRDPNDPSTVVPFATTSNLAELEASGVVTGGMLPKLAATRKALEGGVTAVHLLSAFAPEALLIELFTNEGIGTMIRDVAE